jgi:small-conductance mechanosensitive channel
MPAFWVSAIFANQKLEEAQTQKEILIDDIHLNGAANAAPVVPFVDTLFVIYGNSGIFTAQKKAALIEDNIRKLEKTEPFIADSLIITRDEENLLIVYNDLIIIGINDQQARSINISKEKIAQTYREIIINAVLKQKENSSWLTWLQRTGLSIILLLTTYLIIKYIIRLFSKMILFIHKKREKTIKSLYYIIDSDKQIAFISNILKFTRLLFIIVVSYVCLTTFFSIFPQTKIVSDKLLGYIINPLNKIWTSFVNFLPDLFAIIVIVAVFRVIFKMIKIIAQRIENESIIIRGFYKEWSMPTYNIARIVISILMLIFIFPHLPFFDNKAFQGISVFIGVLFSLGSTSIISNIVSGIVITYMRPFKIGDRIKMGEYTGNVVEKTPLVTRIRTPKNELITIPNGNIMTAQTFNYTESAKEYGLILHTSITMGYDRPWTKIHALLIEAGLKTPDVLQNPKPFVLQTALNDFYAEYQINVYTDEADKMLDIYSGLHKNIQDIFNREGIELVAPHYSAHRDGSDIVIPKEQNKTGIFHTSPFNMKIVKEENPK